MPGEQKSDAEIIATFMEPKPEMRPFSWTNPIEWGQPTPGRWWWPVDSLVSGELHGIWKPRTPLTLNECHLVEAKLSTEQVAQYSIALVKVLPLRGREAWTWHATAEQKIRALAAVLRPVVEPKAGE